MERRSSRRAALLTAFALAAAGCATLPGGKALDVRVVRLVPLASTAFEHRLRVELRVANPTGRSYTIDTMRFVLDVNGRRLATGTTHDPIALPPHGEAVVPIATTTTLLDVVNEIAGSGGRSAPTFEYDVRGTLKLKGAWGSISYQRHGTEADLAALPRRG